MINKSNYAKVGSFTTVIPQLTKLHTQRMASNQNYKYLLDDIADYKKRDAEKSITLNEATLKQERESDDQKTFERNNLKRVAVGLPALKKGETAKAEDRKIVATKGSDLDFLKVEAGQILTDYIALDNKVTTVVVRP
jgi:carboxyl-terminal processing protease